MPPIEILNKIIEAGSKAPSADNGQPWRIKIKSENEILLYHFPSKFEKLLPILKEISLVGHGAVLENMRVASANFSYRMAFNLLPETDSNLIADIRFEKMNEKDTNTATLFESIHKRHTNRSSFDSVKLTSDEKIKLSEKPPGTNEINFKLIEDTSTIKILARAVSTNEQVVLSNKILHEYFFHLIRFNKNEIESTEDGMPVKTLALPLPAEIIFYLCRYWPLMKTLNYVGMAKAIATQNAKIYQKSAAFGILSVKEHSPNAFIKTGIVMQHLWLTATSLGLQFQPVTAVPYYARLGQNSKNSIISQSEKNILNYANNSIKQVNGNENLTATFIFRLGHGTPVRTNTLRYPVSKILF